MEIGEELASRRIGGGPEVVEIIFFVSVMVDGCGRQEESGTEAANVSVGGLRRGKGTTKVWRPPPICGRSHGRWLEIVGRATMVASSFYGLWWRVRNVKCCVGWIIDGWAVRGPGSDGQTLFHLEVNSLGKRISSS